MNLETLKSKPALYGIGAGVVIYIAYRLLTSGSSSTTVPEMTVSGLVPDLNAIKVAQDYSLANKQLDSSMAMQTASLASDYELAKLGKEVVGMNNDAYLSQLNAQNESSLKSQMSAQDYNFKSFVEANLAESAKNLLNFNFMTDTLHTNADVALEQLYSAERVKGAELTVSNAQQAAQRELEQLTMMKQSEYNNAVLWYQSALSNTQETNRHDEAKKAIKAGYYGGIIDSVAGIATTALTGGFNLLTSGNSKKR